MNGTGHKNLLPRLAAAILLIGLCLYLARDVFTLEAIQSGLARFQLAAEADPVFAVAVYLLAYLAVALVFLPGGILMALLGGYLFGFSGGMLWILCGLGLGIACGFILSRYVIGGAIQARYAGQLRWLNREIERYGLYFLFVLRLLPILPFSMVNYLAGTTRIPFSRYLAVSLAGEIPGSLVCAWAGRELALLQRAEDVFTPRVTAVFLVIAVLALLPVAVSLYRRWSNSGRG